MATEESTEREAALFEMMCRMRPEEVAEAVATYLYGEGTVDAALRIEKAAFGRVIRSGRNRDGLPARFRPERW